MTTTAKKSPKGTSKARAKKAAVPVPATIAEVERLEQLMSAYLQSIETFELDAQIRISAIEEELALKVSPILEQVRTLASQIYAYASEHRDELTQNGKTQSAALGVAGVIKWIDTPDSIHVADTEAVLKALRVLGLSDFIRSGPDEINKQAMLNDKERAAAVPGISIVSGTKAYIQPTGQRAHVETIVGKKGPGKWKTVWPKDEIPL